jgi:hypothetical protein
MHRSRTGAQPMVLPAGQLVPGRTVLRVGVLWVTMTP